MEDIIPILHELDSFGANGVLATIIHVEGSSYKKEGACMLIRDDGKQVGMLSAGCLEEDLSFKAIEVLAEGRAKVFTYDMREDTDLSWGQGAGCNGIVRIVLEPIDKKLKMNLLTLKGHLDRGEKVLHIKRFTNDLRLIEDGFFTESGNQFGGTLENSFIRIPGDLFEKTSMFHCMDSTTKMFTYLYRPKPRLFIFGAGSDAKPVVKFASEVGFSATLCDWRPALCNLANFPSAENIVLGFPWEIFKKIRLTQDDFVIIMTHDFQKDKEILSSLLNYDLRYLGILGPRERTKRLFEDKVIPSWISSPIGLPIGAKGPEEIAISMVAEMVQILRTPIKVKA